MRMIDHLGDHCRASRHCAAMLHCGEIFRFPKVGKRHHAAAHQAIKAKLIGEFLRKCWRSGCICPYASVLWGTTRINPYTGGRLAKLDEAKLIARMVLTWAEPHVDPTLEADCLDVLGVPVRSLGDERVL